MVDPIQRQENFAELKRNTFAVLAASALLVVGCASQRVVVVESGRYAPTVPVGEEAAPATATGMVHLIDNVEGPVLAESTQRIVARVGDHFGFRMKAPHGKVSTVVKYVVRVHHPPFTNPETGVTSSVEQWDMQANLGIERLVGYRFDAPWELAPGEWVFEVRRLGKVVARVPFEVVVAEP